MDAPAGIYAHLDDLRLAGRDLSQAPGLTLTSVVHDEGWFLPAFLDHYRALGVERFVLLDDRSSDGSRAYLAAQPDVMLVESERRFGEPAFPAWRERPFSRIRMIHAWRTLLLQKFSMGRWSLLVDADEFLTLPAGMGLADLVTRAEAAGGRAVPGVLLDLYPAEIGDLDRPGAFDPESGWFFDGEPHLALRPGARPLPLHPGARARLHSQFGRGESGLRRTLRRWRHGTAYPRLNDCAKLVLLRWQPEDFLTESHWAALEVAEGMLLPVRHYKFTPDTPRRIARAMAERGYADGSAEYVRLAALLDRMRAQQAAFGYRRSRPVEGFARFAETGNALLP